MSSLSNDCAELKKRYDTCFNKWYSDKFLQGNTESNHECDDIFKLYKACVWKAIKEKKLDVLIQDARQERPLESIRDDKQK